MRHFGRSVLRVSAGGVQMHEGDRRAAIHQDFGFRLLFAQVRAGRADAERVRVRLCLLAF